MNHYITQDNMKQSSLAAVLNHVMENGPATRRAIQQESGFSWGTISENAAELIHRGYLCEEKEKPSGSAGRTGCRLKPDGTRIVSIGLDINRSGLTGQIVGFDGSVKHTIRADFAARTQTDVLDAAQQLCQQALSFCRDRFDVMSIGVAFQGAVDNQNGVSLRFPLEETWVPCSIRQLFEERYRIFTYLDHDPKCMLYAKARSLQQQAVRLACRNLMLIRIDESIGMSVMLDGHICEDVDKMELAHTLAVYNGIPCSCGRRGCLDAYASIRGISRRCGADFSYILAHEAQFSTVLSEAMQYLAIALHNAAMLFYPDKIILTGTYVEQDKNLVQKLVPVFTQLEAAPQRRSIELCVDGNISAAYGAALKSMREAIRDFRI